MSTSLSQLQSTTGVGFGTSGIRGPVDQLTDFVCYSYTVGFLTYLQSQKIISPGDFVAIAGDLRSSTPKILLAINQAITDQGYQVTNCGHIPTPALILFGTTKHLASIMVTGSHIPNDRNGIKFSLPTGEILKSDEAAIVSQVVNIPQNLFDHQGSLLIKGQLPSIDPQARQLYLSRFLDFFPNSFLKGKKIGLFGHSAVGRDLISQLLTSFSAQVVELGFSNDFIPIDTENLSSELQLQCSQWVLDKQLDALLSTDGDGDRPLLFSETGEWYRSDVIGIPAAKYLGVQEIITPVSSNTALEKSGYFTKIIRTKVGSPYLVEEMARLINQGDSHIASFEANGGLLTASPFTVDGKTLSPLPTRDAILPLLCNLALSVRQGQPLSSIISSLPARFTASSSVKNLATDLGHQILQDQSAKIEQSLIKQIGPISDRNTLDGLRLTFQNGDIVHFRPSNNSPEFRNYTESSTSTRAVELSQIANDLINNFKVSP